MRGFEILDKLPKMLEETGLKSEEKDMLLRRFEELDEETKVNELSKILEEADFVSEIHKSSQGNINIYYSKDDVDVVFCAIAHKMTDYVISCAIIDKDVFDSIFRGTNRVLTLKERSDNHFKVICSSGGYNNAALHWIATGGEVGIDHITHNLGINLKKYLRVCSSKENNFNKVCRSKVYKSRRKFSMPNSMVNPEDQKILEEQGYVFTDQKIYSPSFENEEDMYRGLKYAEDICLKEFRYNPLVDFSETWYALVLHEMLGIISQSDVEDYNRDYFIRTQPEVAKYYML